MSRKDKKARKIIFDQSTTIVMGSNHTGKSSLVKSIYHAFGTETIFNDMWKNAGVSTLVRFEIDGASYSIIRDGKAFGVWDFTGQIIAFDKVTDGIGIYLANLFNFKLKLASQSNELITPPPAYFLLPFYVDQDNGWKSNWSSFNRLTQIKNFRDAIINYHTGIRGNDYYETKHQIENLAITIQELDHEQKVARNILSKLKEKTGAVEFSLNLEEFEEEVKSLLIESEKLRKTQEHYKTALVDLHNERIILEHHLTLAKQALLEAHKDYKYAVDDLDQHSVECPTCGAEYDNSFADRLEIAKDEQRCSELVLQISSELNSNREKIEKETIKYKIATEELLKIETLLETKKGELKLKDIIENQGRQEIKKVFEESIDELKSSLSENARQQQNLKNKLTAGEDKKRRERIVDEYKTLVRRFVTSLEVFSWKEDDYEDILTRVNETGSSKPRALMAYYYAILHVIHKYSQAVFCPIVIDSPNQHGQDKINMPNLINFILNNKPESSQLILSLEENYGVDLDAYHTITLDQKYNFLKSEDFEEVNDEMSPLLLKTWNTLGSLF